jgi:hypothetical protein
VSSNALETDESSWEFGHFGGHRVWSEDLIDFALTFISAKKVIEGASNQKDASFLLECSEDLVNVIRVFSAPVYRF